MKCLKCIVNYTIINIITNINMSSQKIYKLAMFENEIGEWVFINRPFIIENSSLLSGIFLRDTWFCYKIEKKKIL